MKPGPKLPHLGCALNALRSRLRFRQRRQKHRGENRNDGNDHEQFDQGKSTIWFVLRPHWFISATCFVFGSISNFFPGGACGTGRTYPAAITSEKLRGIRLFSKLYFLRAWVRSARVLSMFPGSVGVMGITVAVGGGTAAGVGAESALTGKLFCAVGSWLAAVPLAAGFAWGLAFLQPLIMPPALAAHTRVKMN